MPIEDVVQEILADAEKKTSEIKKKLKNERDKIIKEVEEKAKKIIDEYKEKARRDVEKIRRQEIASAELMVKREKLKEQAKLLETVFEKAKKRLLGFPLEKHREICEKMVKKYGTYKKKVYCHPSMKKYVQIMPGVYSCGEVKCLGGVIVEDEDEKVRYNMLYETILDDIYEKDLKKIAHILFKERR